MIIKKEKNRLTVKGEYFSVKQILFSGQVFRFKPHLQGYMLNAGSQAAYLRQNGDTIIIECSNEDFFYNYFDLDTDYQKIILKLNEYPFMHSALSGGRGIRILRQQRLETLISFIISANNNIKRISKIIEAVCVGLGEQKEFNGVIYNAFPDTERLSAADTDFFIKAGAGYRAEYLQKTVKMLKNGFELDAVETMSLKDARKALMSLSGVGRKVCDCILLFAYNRGDVFPVDTWMEKVYNDYTGCGTKAACREKMADYFAEIFGGYAGYAQQYLFYYKRGSVKLK